MIKYRHDLLVSVEIMLANRMTIRLSQDLEQARDDSLALWQKIVGINETFRVNDANSLAPGSVSGMPLNLKGRYQVGDGNEFECEIRNISPVGIGLRGPKEGRIGKSCSVYIPSVGIVEGIVVQAGVGSLTVGVIALPARIQRLARRLRWQLRHDLEKIPDRRASERIDMNRAKATLKTSDGRIFPCEIFDISEGGAALHLGSAALYFWVDQPITLNERAGHVLRYFPGGLVMKFSDA